MSCITANVNEGSTHWLTLEFLDKAGVAAVPTTVRLRIDCLTTNTIIRAPADLAGVAATMELVLSATDNRIVDQANPQERRRVTVKSTFGVGDEMTAEYDFVVANLSFIPMA